MTVRKSSGAEGTSDELMASSMVRALLRELLSKLAILAAEERTDYVDLRRLPLPPGTLEALKVWLGCGEIEATVKALGITTMQETAIAGVWWVRHVKLEGDILAEHLEITRCPALLTTHHDDVSQAAEVLRSRLAVLESSPAESPTLADSR